MVPFESIQGFITTTSNLLRETNANTCLLISKIERMEATQHSLTHALTTVLAKLDNQRSLDRTVLAPASIPSITPAPLTLITEYFSAPPGKNALCFFVPWVRCRYPGYKSAYTIVVPRVLIVRTIYVPQVHCAT